VKRLFLVLALIFSLVAPLTARPFSLQTNASRISQGAAPARATAAKPVSDIQSKILANGLEVVVFEDHSVPIVTIELAVRNGSFTEPPELNGLSHLYEHMFFKANRAVANAEDYLQRIGQLGIAYNGETREEVVEYYFTTTSPNIRAAMNFMRDAARYPLFDEREFERERQVVIGEIDRNESEPGYYLNKEMNELLYYKFPSRKQPLGNRQTVSTATTAMMKLIQGRYYVPNNSALVVTGDVRAADVYNMAQEFFGDWARREKDPFVEFPMVEHPPLPKSSTASRMPISFNALRTSDAFFESASEISGTSSSIERAARPLSAIARSTRRVTPGSQN
jgi:zinc protease